MPASLHAALVATSALPGVFAFATGFPGSVCDDNGNAALIIRQC